jgi:hypothetical protein
MQVSDDRIQAESGVPSWLCFEAVIINLRATYLCRMYGGADKSLAQPTSRFILCDGENISFDVSLVIYI